MSAKLALTFMLVAVLGFAEDVANVPALSSATSTIRTEPVARPEPIKIVLDGARHPGECMEEGKRVQKEVQTLAFPPGWTIAIMCTQVRWEQLIQQVDPPRTHEAFTRISERITVLNGAIFHDFPPNYRHIMAHELAHIRCGGCTDEGYVDKLAVRLEKGLPVEQVAFKASPAKKSVSLIGSR